jgi:hypothetical protein
VRKVAAVRALALFAVVGCSDGNERVAKRDPVATASRLEFGRYVCAPQARRSPCTRGVRRGTDYWYILPVHCGVDDAYFDGRLWVTRPRLMNSRSPGNPPRWLDNPQQRGMMRLVSSRRAEFRARGHTIVFKPAPRGYRSGPCD